MIALRDNGEASMTTKTTKPPAGTAADAAVASTDGVKAATGGTKAKPGTAPGATRQRRQRPAVADGEAKAERKTRADTKQAKLVAMLETKDAATVEEIAAAFGWQTHTVRGVLYGALKKKLGLNIISEKVEGRGRVYRIGN
jgi:hypothetical protein